MEEIKLNVTTDNNEVIIRTGDAEPVIPRRKSVEIKGNLNTPLNYLKHPPKWFKDGEDNTIADSPFQFSNLKVDRDKMSITLVVDEGSEWESVYKGSLEFGDIYKRFGINSNKSFTTHELAELIKMHRSYFETKDIAMKLVSELRNFKAKVDKQIEDADDMRGNKRVLYQQAVDSNIPNDFKLNIPVFKGYESQHLELEISIDASDFSCRLISPEASDYVNELKNGLIDEQVAQIKELNETLKVFEV